MPAQALPPSRPAVWSTPQQPREERPLRPLSGSPALLQGHPAAGPEALKRPVAETSLASLSSVRGYRTGTGDMASAGPGSPIGGWPQGDWRSQASWPLSHTREEKGASAPHFRASRKTEPFWAPHPAGLQPGKPSGATVTLGKCAGDTLPSYSLKGQASQQPGGAGSLFQETGLSPRLGVHV